MDSGLQSLPCGEGSSVSPELTGSSIFDKDLIGGLPQIMSHSRASDSAIEEVATLVGHELRPPGSSIARRTVCIRQLRCLLESLPLDGEASSETEIDKIAVFCTSPPTNFAGEQFKLGSLLSRLPYYSGSKVPFVGSGTKSACSRKVDMWVKLFPFNYEEVPSTSSSPLPEFLVGIGCKRRQTGSFARLCSLHFPLCVAGRHC